MGPHKTHSDPAPRLFRPTVPNHTKSYFSNTAYFRFLSTHRNGKLSIFYYCVYEEKCYNFILCPLFRFVFANEEDRAGGFSGIEDGLNAEVGGVVPLHPHSIDVERARALCKVYCVYLMPIEINKAE